MMKTNGMYVGLDVQAPSYLKPKDFLYEPATRLTLGRIRQARRMLVNECIRKGDIDSVDVKYLAEFDQLIGQVSSLTTGD